MRTGPTAPRASRAHLARLLVVAALLLVGCREPVLVPHTPTEEVHRVTGEPLPPPPIPHERRAALAAAADEAKIRWEAQPEDEDALIWWGRRLAYEGRYRAALAAYDVGLSYHPGSPRLRRHRGHRYITVRDFDRAVADLAEARRLAAGMPDEVEPDGAPNPAGIPRSTMQGNIAYHLALAHYLRGEFDEAAEAWTRGLAWGQNDDSLVSTSWWLYLSRRRAGDEQGAAALLEPVQAEMDILENHAYHQLLLMAKGEVDVESLRPARPQDLESSTLGYGVAAYLLCEGREEEAYELMAAVCEGAWWPAFGHIAAEADLARAGRGP